MFRHKNTNCSIISISCTMCSISIIIISSIIGISSICWVIVFCCVLLFLFSLNMFIYIPTKNNPLGDVYIPTKNNPIIILLLILIILIVILILLILLIILLILRILIILLIYTRPPTAVYNTSCIHRGLQK